jgi:hypothetical protein
MRFPLRWLAGALLLLAIFALYLLTLDDGLRPDELMGGDLITHQYAQAEARFANAPGYPIYTMLGWAWFHSLRPLLRWAFNPVQVLSLYSTFWAMLSLLLLYSILLRLFPRNWPLALWGTAFYAVTYFFWYYAVTTEQYTSAVFQTLLLLWLALKWEEERNNSLLLGMAFVAGTCAANLVTTLLILPPLVLFILREEPTILRNRSLILKASTLALLPLLSYVYVYIRGAQHPGWRGQGEWPSTLAWFLEFLTAPQGRSEMSWTLWPPSPNYPWLAFRELSWPVMLMGLAGWAFLGRRKASLFYGTALLYFAFCYIDRFGNWYQVIMPLYPLIIIGTTAFAERILRAWPNLGVRLALGAFLVLLFAWRLAKSYPMADQSGRPDATALEPGWAILADNPSPGSCIAGTYSENLALQYLMSIWGAKPKVNPVTVEEALKMAWQGESCYVTRQAVHLLGPCREGLHPSSAGENLILLQTRPTEELPREACLRECFPVKLVGTEITPGMKIAGYAAGWEGRKLRITLFWQATRSIASDYFISVRLIQGGEFFQQDHPPVWGAYPTSCWKPGEIVRDDYFLEVPQGQAGKIEVVVYYLKGKEPVSVGETALPNGGATGE